MSPRDLLPCPFCGGAGKVSDNGTGLVFYVRCETCHCASPRERCAIDAEHAWNRRADPAITHAQADALEAAAKKVRSWRETITSDENDRLGVRSLVIKLLTKVEEDIRTLSPSIPDAGWRETAREVLTKCAERFREYEQSHAEKAADLRQFAHLHSRPTAERYDVVEAQHRDAKAARNREMAELCEAALSSLPPPPAENAEKAGGLHGAQELCSDCPPEGYQTDATRCLPCPRRASLRSHAVEGRDG